MAELTGGRKFSMTDKMLLFIAGGFVLCILTLIINAITGSKVPEEAIITLYTLFLGGCVGNNGVFTLGNAAEHNAKAKATNGGK